MNFIMENADATPPHLDVLLRLGSSGDMLGFCSYSATGSRAIFTTNCRQGPTLGCHFYYFWGTWAPLGTL